VCTGEIDFSYPKCELQILMLTRPPCHHSPSIVFSAHGPSEDRAIGFKSMKF
jgi:hypothetical protein